MNNTQRNQPSYVTPAHRKLASANLKKCPLCEALNAVANQECFVCRWQGQFVHDPTMIEQGLQDLLDRCPDYGKRPTPAALRKASKLQALMRRFLKRSLDFRV